MNTTRHDLISHKLWPRPETRNKQEINTIPMHKKQWGGSKVMTNIKTWASESAKTTPRSMSTATTAERSIISYDIA
jgi:hypothetical protein